MVFNGGGIVAGFSDYPTRPVVGSRTLHIEHPLRRAAHHCARNVPDGDINTDRAAQALADAASCATTRFSVD
jgi:hypothetical protein